MDQAIEQQCEPHNISSSSVPGPSMPMANGASLIESQVFLPPQKTIGNIRYTPESPAWHCSFSRNGEWLAACFGAPNPCIRLWRLERHKHHHEKAAPPTPTWIFHSTLEFHERTIRSVAFCPLSSTFTLAAASFDATVTIWEYDRVSDVWECTTQLEGHENEVKCVVWNETGSLLATCGRDKTVWIWETFLDGSIGGTQDNDFECLSVLNGHDGDVKSLQFAPSHGIWGDGEEILLSASYDDTIKVWAEDAGDWYCAVSLSVHTDTVWSLAVAPGGGRFVSASADGSVAIFKSYTPSERKEQCLDSEKAGGSDDDDESKGLFKCVGVLSGAHDQSTVCSIAYAPARAGHGRIVSGGSDNRIQIYREVGSTSTSDKPLFTMDVAIDTSHGDVNCVCWHPQDGSILCSAGDDGTVRIWRYDI